MKLTIIEQTDEITHVALAGSLNIAGVHAIDVEFHRVTAAREKPAIVDISAVDFISSLSWSANGSPMP